MLAYWFMDDGGKLDYNKNTKNNSLVLKSHNFTTLEVENYDQYLKLNSTLKPAYELIRVNR